MLHDFCRLQNIEDFRSQRNSAAEWSRNVLTVSERSRTRWKWNQWISLLNLWNEKKLLRRKARLCVYFKKWCCDVSFITAVCVNSYIVIDKSKYLVAKPWLLPTNNFKTNFVFGFVIVYMLFHTCAHAYRTLCVELTRCNKTLFCLLPWISLNLIHHDSILQWWDALRVYNTLSVIFKAKFWVPSRCISTSLMDLSKTKPWRSLSRITNPLYGPCPHRTHRKLSENSKISASRCTSLAR